MEKTSPSYNTTTVGLRPVKFLTPEVPQLVLYLALTFLFFVGLNVNSIWSFLTTGSGSLNELVAGSSFNRAWHIVSTSNLVASLFWALLGSAIYLAVWFFRSIITNIRNDLVVASYIHPV